MEKFFLWNRYTGAKFPIVRYKRGISNEQSGIFIAIDDEKNLTAKPISVGRLETTDAKKLLSGYFEDGSTLITDSHSAYIQSWLIVKPSGTFKLKPTDTPKVDTILQMSMEFIHR